MSRVLLYYYCLSLVSINRLTKNSIFLRLFSKYLTLGTQRGATACHYTPSMSNITPDLDSVFPILAFSYHEPHLRFYFTKLSDDSIPF